MTDDTLLDLDADRLREECGVFGIFGHPDAAAITALGLHALQHRGQEAAGIVSFDGSRFHSERRLGLVGDAFSRRDVIDRLPGNAAVGHVRYSTTGETILRNVQPLFAELNAGGFAVGHNGNLTNGLTLRRQLVREGAMMQSTTDTEVILHLVARSHRNRFVDRFIEGLRDLRFRRPDQQEAGRRARSAWYTPAGARQARRLSDSRLGNVRTRHHRRSVRSRC
jgi:amidophosphoribosyltransferase